MKTTKIFLALAVVVGVAVCAYAQGAKGATPLGQSDKTEIDNLASMSFETLIAKGQASSVQDKPKVAIAIGRKAPGSKQDVNRLLDFLDSRGKAEEEDIVRDSANNSLRKITDPAYGVEFAKRVKKGKFRTRLVAIEMVGKLKNKEAVPDLVNMVDGYSKLKQKLEGNESQLRFHAASALGEIGDERGIPALVNQLGKMGGYEVKSLSKFGKRVLPTLLDKARGSKSTDEKRAASDAITLMRDKSALPELWRVLRDEKDVARYAAVYALLESTEKDTSPTSDEVMNYIASNASNNLQFQAMAISVAQKRKDVSYLTKVFQNTSVDHGQRTGAIIALGEIKDTVAVPALEAALKDQDMEIRYLAGMALKRITGKEYQ